MNGRVGILPSVLMARPVPARLPYPPLGLSTLWFPGLLKNGLSSSISSAVPTTVPDVWLRNSDPPEQPLGLTWFDLNTRVSCLRYKNPALSRCAVSDTASRHSSHFAGRQAMSGAQGPRPRVCTQLGPFPSDLVQVQWQC